MVYMSVIFELFAYCSYLLSIGKDDEFEVLLGHSYFKKL